MGAAAAFIGPVAGVAAHLYAARVSQVVLLGFVASPLLVAGLGSSPARAWPPLLRRLLSPLPVLLGFYLYALLALHLLARASTDSPWLLGPVLLLGLALWWPVAGPGHRLDIGSALIYVLLNWLLVTGLFGALLFGYGAAPHAPGLLAGERVSPATDRQWGAVVLGVVSHVAFGVAAVALFVRWLRAERHRHAPLRLYQALRRAGIPPEEARALAGLEPGPGPRQAS